ncbi:hypothetical protein [Haloarcula sediminis]|uniref:hypothetical protein n=1 Tax=Haloarcula sediminis TaxID=3111777 RepID=UPI002D77DB11|nr:hypothetical protein [Haloarcula sp. CK38]
MTRAFDLVKFAASSDQELFFDAPLEVEIMDSVPTADGEQQREYQLLATSAYSLSEAIAEVDGARTGPLGKSEFRIPDSEVERYLELMHEDEIDSSIHDHPAANRSTVVALADAGYRAPADFLSESVDHLDIAQEAGIDRDVVGSIASQFVGGFSTGSELRDERGPFADQTIADSFTGWQLQQVSPDDTVIRWVSDGRFNVTIKHSDGRFSVVVNTPGDEKHPYIRKGREVLLDMEVTDAATAVECAHDWLADNQIPPVSETDLTEELYVGPATHDYLALEYDIRSRADLEVFIRNNPEEAAELLQEDIVAAHLDE